MSDIPVPTLTVRHDPVPAQMPSIGRVVHLYIKNYSMTGSNGPFPAFVADVHSPDTVDIVALLYGHQNVLSVSHCVRKDAVPADLKQDVEAYWEWPPRV